MDKSGAICDELQLQMKKKLKMVAVIELMRINHWFKNWFIVFGVLAYPLVGGGLVVNIWLLVKIFAAFVLASLISSVNYVVNQITDANFDQQHADKKRRPIPSGRVSYWLAVGVGVLICLVTMTASLLFFPRNFSWMLIVFLTAGVIYNVRPIRFKDIPYVDVLSESINNPIRFLLGWFVVASEGFPPMFLLLISWSAGAFLMTAKRFDELAHFGKKLIVYRSTFRHYTRESLLFLLYAYATVTLVLLADISWVTKKSLLIGWPLALWFLVWLIKTIVNGKVNIREVEKFVLNPKTLLYFLILICVYIGFALI